MHQQFIEPTKAFADIIIPNDKYNTVAIDVVRANKSKNSIIYCNFIILQFEETIPIIIGSVFCFNPVNTIKFSLYC
jgi:hypothetical protein